jgi:hydroxymethylglutaryl-CoA lyase
VARALTPVHFAMPNVRITDVSPRDGLQNESAMIAAADKAQLVRLLCAACVDEVEVTSFVSPKWVPQLGDAGAVLADLAASAPSPLTSRPLFSALVPNERGLDSALTFLQGPAALGKLSLFAAASETFSQKNTNGSISQVLERFVPVMHRIRALPHRILVRGYISCVVACPFEGPIAPAQVVDVAKKLIAMGVDEIDLGDTIGAATRETSRELLSTYAREIGFVSPVTLHLHDTFGHAADCVRVALDAGITSFDGSVAGLGGCPYASTPTRRAPGNIDTTLLVNTVHAAGFTTHVDLDALACASQHARKLVQR